MIPVPQLTNENQPALFDRNCRQPGAAWLAVHPDKDPHEQSDWWTQFQPELATHFSNRCGWQATSIGLEGVVEHWLACGHRKGAASPYRHLAFEWTNYRYATGVLNSLKGTLDDRVLDPCIVQEGWFEVQLPSFQLVATDEIPTPLRDKAEFTLEQLQLRRHKARWTRWDWYQRYWNNGVPDMIGLRRDAPLVAIAIDKALAAGQTLPDPDGNEPIHAVEARRRRFGPRRRKSS